MAIIKCSECGKEVSDKSHVCIHCGNPISEERINIVSNSNNSPIEEKSKNVNIKKKSSKTTNGFRSEVQNN